MINHKKDLATFFGYKTNREVKKIVGILLHVGKPQEPLSIIW
jgi:hypothetical protein